MKKILKSFLVAAVFATAFTACSKDDAEAPEQKPREIEMTVVASSELTIGKQSRTAYDPATGTISWNASGEYLKVFETSGSTTTPVTSDEGVVTGGKAAFGVTFTENPTAASFTYNAVYPASALSAWDDDNKDIAKIKVATPTTQQPSATSFDGAADLLIAFPETVTTQPDQLNARFKRVVAIGKMTIKNLNSTEAITAVKFAATDKKLSGRSFIDLSNGAVTEYGYSEQSYDNVVLNYASSLDLKSGMTAYFTCFPFELAAGETFAVTVTTASKIFTRTVTLGENRSLAFTAGNSSTFAVDMATATEETNDTLDGDYVIVAEQSSVYYAMNAAADGTSIRLAATTITYDGTSEFYQTDDATIIWTIAKSDDNYTIANGANYLTWQSGNGATTGNSEYPLTITKNEDNKTYTITSVADSKRILAKNATDKYGFGFYTGSGTNSLLLVKVGADPRTQLTTPQNLMADATGNVVEIVWDAVTGAKDYTVTCGAESQTVTGTDATFTMDYGTEYTIKVVANPTDTENQKSSAAATTTVTTEGNSTVSIKNLIAYALSVNPNLTTANQTADVSDYGGGTVGGYIAANNENGNLTNMLSIVDNTGEPGTGIVVYGPAVNEFANYPVGSKVSISLAGATIKNYNMLYELMDATVTTGSETATIIVPEITLAQFNSNAYMGMRVTVKDVTTQESAQWNSGTDAVNVTLKGASSSETLAVRIMGTAAFKDVYYVAKTGNVSGVAQKYSSTCQIFPCSADDVAAFNNGVAFAKTTFSAAATATSLDIPFALRGTATAADITAVAIATGGDWLTSATKGAAEIACVFPANTTAAERTATIVVTISGQEAVTLTVTQAAAGGAVEEEITIELSGGDAKNHDNLPFSKAPINVVFTKGTHSTAPRWDADLVRFYGAKTMSNNLTISGARITKIQLTTSQGSISSMSANSGAIKDGAWTGSSEEIIFTTTAQTRIKTIVVTYEN